MSTGSPGGSEALLYIDARGEGSVQMSYATDDGVRNITSLNVVHCSNVSSNVLSVHRLAAKDVKFSIVGQQVQAPYQDKLLFQGSVTDGLYKFHET